MLYEHIKPWKSNSYQKNAAAFDFQINQHGWTRFWDTATTNHENR